MLPQRPVGAKEFAQEYAEQESEAIFSPPAVGPALVPPSAVGRITLFYLSCTESKQLAAISAIKIATTGESHVLQAAPA